MAELTHANALADWLANNHNPLRMQIGLCLTLNQARVIIVAYLREPKLQFHENLRRALQEDFVGQILGPRNGISKKDAGRHRILGSLDFLLETGKREIGSSRKFEG